MVSLPLTFVPSRRPPPDPSALHQQTLALRRQHPSWGAGLIRVFLMREHGPSDVPTERTLQRWLCRAGLGPAPKGRRPKTTAPRATRPHEVWQMDAKERVRLRGGEQVSGRSHDSSFSAISWIAPSRSGS